MDRRMRWGVGSLVTLLVVGLWAVGRPQADVRVGTLPTGSSPMKTITVTSTTTAGIESVSDGVPNVGQGTQLFGFSVHAGGSNTECGLYDVTAINSTNLKKANLIDEGGQATQYNDFQSNWPSPYKMQNSILLVHVTGTITTSACVLYVAQ